MKVLFLCSNDTHVRMFAPVMDVLGALGVESGVVSLDPLYGQGATAAARELGLDVAEPPGTLGPRSRPFYQRPVWRIWHDVLQARQPLDALIVSQDAQAVVVGNDYGLIEKLVLHLSARHGMDRVLVQDGRIGSRRAKPSSPLGHLSRYGKTLFSVPVRRLGMPYLAASEYGEGGCRVICASGPRSALLFQWRSRGAADVVVTGQPRYDRLADLAREPHPSAEYTVAVVTTPFTAAGLGADLQGKQEEMVRFLHAAFAPKGIRVVVKPHPREELSDYSDVVGVGNVRSGDPAAVLAEADVAVIGISTLVEEAGILGRPVVIPGQFLHGRRFDGLLPDSTVFPTAETPESLVGLIEGLIDRRRREELAALQRAAMAEDITFSRDVSAARRVADAILER